MTIEKLVEECARDICVEMGNDPDADAGMVAGEGCATWECFTNEARAVIRRTLEFAAGEARQLADQNDQSKMPKWLSLSCDAPAMKEAAELLQRRFDRLARSLSPKEQADG